MISSRANVFLAKNGVVTYKYRESMGYLSAILAFSMETLEFPADFFNEFSLGLGR